MTAQDERVRGQANISSLAEATRTFAKIGLTSFGGPAGQIALMHRVLVEEKRWLSEKRFLHALNFCMLLPGPEAMQLATYAGWMMHGVRGGLIAGSLFVLPGFAVLVVMSAIYALFGDLPAIAGLLLGLKAAVLVIVIQAMVRVTRRALVGTASFAVAIAAFLALAIFRLPFPLAIAAAAVLGFALPGAFLGHDQEDTTRDVPPIARPWRHVGRVLAAGLLLWAVPVAILVGLPSVPAVYGDEALYFSKTAMVTFGGAYAVLAYVGQQAVEHYHWLGADEMLTGLGLAETTPGPLILVLVFVGFIAAFREAGIFDPLFAGLLGAVVTTWVTFVPCFIWIFLGAPFIEQLRGNRKLGSAFAAITAAVVGVIANLSVWFGFHVLFAEVGERAFGAARIWWPDSSSLDVAALAIAAVAALMTWLGAGVFSVLGVCVVLGLAAGLV